MDNKCTAVYIENLTEEIDENCLYEQFSYLGTILYIRIIPENGFGKGYITFTTPESARKAVFDMDGEVIGLNPVNVVMISREAIPVASVPLPTSICSDTESSKNFTYCIGCPGSRLERSSSYRVHTDDPKEREILVKRLFTIIYHDNPLLAVEIAATILATSLDGLKHLLLYPGCLKGIITESIERIQRRTVKGPPIPEVEWNKMREELIVLVEERKGIFPEELTDIIMKPRSLLQIKYILANKLPTGTLDMATWELQARISRRRLSRQWSREEANEKMYQLVCMLYPSYCKTIIEMLMQRDEDDLMDIFISEIPFKNKVDLAFLVHMAYINTTKGRVAHVPGTTTPPRLENLPLKETLYTLIYQLFPERAYMVIQKFLALDPSELTRILNRRYMLKEKVRQTVAMLAAEDISRENKSMFRYY